MGNTLFKHIFKDEIDSTSSYLIKEHNSLENFTFVSTNYQTNGKGREQRQWISVKGTNLLFSFLLKDKDLIWEYTSISLCCAATIARYFIDLGFEGIQIKWPNDVYLNGKKLVGILLEGNVNEYLVVGIGINVNQEVFPDNLHHPATSLYLESGKKYSLDDLKKEIFECLLRDINIKNIQEKRYLNLINERNYLLGKNVFATINGKKIPVNVLGISKDNSLIVEHGNKTEYLISGEIEFE